MIYWLTIYGFSFFATEAVAMACEARWSQKTRLPVGGEGALKMQDKTLQDRTMTDKLAGPDIVGQDNDGQTGRV